MHEVATNSSSSGETKKLEGKLDALVNLVSQLAMNKKSAPDVNLSRSGSLDTGYEGLDDSST